MATAMAGTATAGTTLLVVGVAQRVTAKLRTLLITTDDLPVWVPEILRLTIEVFYKRV